MSPLETAQAFFDAINHGDSDKIFDLMTDDHIFIDSLGGAVRGREAMRAGWQGYFAMCPDYRVSQETIFEKGDTVAAFGSAGGTIRENRWSTSAAWRLVVRKGLVQQFQVYADNKPVYEILAGPAQA